MVFGLVWCSNPLVQFFFSKKILLTKILNWINRIIQISNQINRTNWTFNLNTIETKISISFDKFFLKKNWTVRIPYRTKLFSCSIRWNFGQIQLPEPGGLYNMHTSIAYSFTNILCVCFQYNINRLRPTYFSIKYYVLKTESLINVSRISISLYRIRVQDILHKQLLLSNQQCHLELEA